MTPENKARILVVEDEANLGNTLVEVLIDEGYEATLAKTEKEARNKLKVQNFDLALLDVGLPDGSGFNVAKFINDNKPETAIIFLTAYGNPEDRIRGLELGSEDYIVKPFHLKELLLRIKNGLKRSKYFSQLPNTTIQIGNALINFECFEAKVNNKTHTLTHKECMILRLLVERKGKVVSRDEILDFVWAKEEYPSTRTVDNFIMKLRRIVEQDPENPIFIKSIRGVGYQLT